MRAPRAVCGLVLIELLGCAAAPPEAPRPSTTNSAARSPAPKISDGRRELPLAESRAVVRKLSSKVGSELPARHLESVEGILETPLVLGNQAQLLVDGPATHAAMFKAIESARDHVNLESYILEAGPIGGRLASLLERKIGEGVTVNVLFDGVGSMSTPAAYFERLDEAGVALCEFNPVNPAKAKKGWHLNNRDHRKILVVDGRVAFTGGINISSVYSSSSFGRGNAPRDDPAEDGWRDTHVQLQGPIVADLQQLFLESWTSQNCPKLRSADYFPTLSPHGAQVMRVVAQDPAAERSDVYLALLSAFENSEKRIWLTYGYFAPDPQTLEVLMAAAARGVDVRLVLPGVSDFWVPLYAGRSHYQDLLEARIRLFERKDALLHAKTAVVDGVWSTVGSTNLDWRSFVHNYEVNVIVLDREFGRGMEGVFERDQGAAIEITEEKWRNRGIGTRIKEWIARRWAYLL